MPDEPQQKFETWAVGFEIPERCHAMLVKEHTPAGLWGPMTKRTARKSFFRRLAERKGSPAIDFEQVIWAVKARKANPAVRQPA